MSRVGPSLSMIEVFKCSSIIQAHVEHFKQELGREVMSMTEEVGRLHREKQNIENQISDLFAFYSKQKKTDMVWHISIACTDNHWFDVKASASSSRECSVTYQANVWARGLEAQYTSHPAPFRTTSTLKLCAAGMNVSLSYVHSKSYISTYHECVAPICLAVAAILKLLGTTVCLKIDSEHVPKGHILSTDS